MIEISVEWFEESARLLKTVRWMRTVRGERRPRTLGKFRRFPGVDVGRVLLVQERKTSPRTGTYRIVVPLPHFSYCGASLLEVILDQDIEFLLERNGKVRTKNLEKMKV